MRPTPNAEKVEKGLDSQTDDELEHGVEPNSQLPIVWMQ